MKKENLTVINETLELIQPVYFDENTKQFSSLATRLTAILKLKSGNKVAGYCFIDLATYLND